MLSVFSVSSEGCIASLPQCQQVTASAPGGLYSYRKRGLLSFNLVSRQAELSVGPFRHRIVDAFLVCVPQCDRPTRSLQRPPRVRPCWPNRSELRKSSAPVTRVTASAASAAMPALPREGKVEGEVPADWNWENWTHSFTEDAFKGNWGDWVFFDLEGSVTKQFRGKRLGWCNPERTVWIQKNFHNVELTPGRTFNETEQMYEMQWQLEKDSSNLPEGLMHSFMPKARIVTFDKHTRCLVHLNLSEKADSRAWETSYTDGKYHTSVTPTWRSNSLSSCGVIREEWESWPDFELEQHEMTLRDALAKLELKRVRQITWPEPGGKGMMQLSDISGPDAWPTTASGYHEIGIPLGAWAIGPSTLPEPAASNGFWLSTAKTLQNGGIRRIVQVYAADSSIEKILLEEYLSA